MVDPIHWELQMELMKAIRMKMVQLMVDLWDVQRLKDEAMVGWMEPLILMDAVMAGLMGLQMCLARCLVQMKFVDLLERAGFLWFQLRIWLRGGRHCLLLTRLHFLLP